MGAPVALFAGAWMVGMCQLFYRGGGLGFGSGYEMVAIARTLAAHGVYANPFAPAITGPTAWEPPIHPLFLAALIGIFGDTVWMRIAATIASIAANAFVAALLPRLSIEFYGSTKAGVIGGLLWILSMQLMPAWDVSQTTLILLCFCLLTARNVRRRECDWWPAAAGALGGVLLLMNPATALVMAPWMIWLFVSGRVAWRSAVAYCSVATLASALVLAPWLVRNYRIWGAFELRTGLGITLYSSDNDCASSSLYQEMLSGCFQRTYADNESEESLLRTLGEVSYDRQRKQDAMHWIFSHPRRFAELTAGRVVDFWFPDPGFSPYSSYAIWVITVLSIPGIVLSIGRREATTPLILSIWLIYPLMYYVVFSADRYRYPILWTSLLPAGYGLVIMADALKARLRTP